MGKYFTVTEAGKNRYRIYDPLGVHMELFVGSEKALLLDTGYGIGDLRQVVRTITDLPLYIVNSHGHMDHACGNYQFDEAIYIHPKDIPVCKDHHSVYRKTQALRYARNAVDSMTGEKLEVINNDFDEAAYFDRDMGKLTEVREGHLFDLGSMNLKVIEVPGHTPGSIGLLYERERVFYAGDAMNDSLWLFLPEACPLSVYRETLNKAWNLDFDSLIVSHCPVPLSKEVLLDYMDMADHLDYAKGIAFSAPLVPEANARICVRSGYTLEDMEKGVAGFASIVINESHLH